MYTAPFSGNSIYAANPELLELRSWRIGRIAMFCRLCAKVACGTHDPWCGLLPAVYAVTFIVGGFWEVLFASIRKHEVNEVSSLTSILSR